MTASCSDRALPGARWTWLAAPAASFALALAAGLLLLPLAGPAAPLGEPLADLWDLICRSVPVGLAEAAGSPMETGSGPSMPVAVSPGDARRVVSLPVPPVPRTPAVAASDDRWLFDASAVPIQAGRWPGRPLNAPPLSPVFVARAELTGS